MCAHTIPAPNEFFRSTSLRYPAFSRYASRSRASSPSTTPASGLSIAPTSSFWCTTQPSWMSAQRPRPFSTSWRGASTRRASFWTRRTRWSPKSCCAFRALSFGTFRHWCRRPNRHWCIPHRCGHIPTRMVPRHVCSWPRSVPSCATYVPPSISASNTRSLVHVALP